MKPGKKRGVSLGTVFMLFLLAVVLGGSGWVLSRLAGGSIDLSHSVHDVLELADNGIKAEMNQPSQRKKTEASVTEVPRGEGQPDQPAGEQLATVTLGGTVAIEKNIRQSCYSTDSGKYDFSELLALLHSRLSSDVNVCFLENILEDNVKVSTTVVPAGAAEALKTAGFDTAASGFSAAWSRGAEGIQSTRNALTAAGLTPLGIFSDAAEADEPLMLSAGEMRIALLQYTDGVAAKTRKSMGKAGTSRCVPEADIAAVSRDIQTAREMGAQAVLVLLNWQKAGAQTPGKAQKALAQQIADAGADVIVGAGSRVAQTAEYLRASDGSGRETLCVYSLGTLISDSRKASQLAGYLVHLELAWSTETGLSFQSAAYTPVYTWKYRQDSRDYYHTLAADAPVPDGMDGEQAKAMNTAKDRIAKLLADSPLTAWQ